VEAALQVVPEAHRDSWRVHRIENGETMTDLARRFNTSSSAIIAANRDDMPETGDWVAIPVAYPGDRQPVRTSSRKPITKTGAHTATAASHPSVAHASVARQAPAKPAVKRISKTTVHSAGRS
jgi:hypothetical protein